MIYRYPGFGRGILLLLIHNNVVLNIKADSFCLLSLRKFLFMQDEQVRVQKAYNEWAAQYDTNYNRTRDMEAAVLRETLSPLSFERCLEIGCGTGKNTLWLMEKAVHLTAADLSEGMLAKAKEKINAPHVNFVQTDITAEWPFDRDNYDLATFSLVLEHIEALEPVLKNVYQSLRNGGWLYIGELHPFKQYQGSKARFDTAEGTQVVDCFNHHVSDFTNAAANCGFRLISLQEYFDEDDRKGSPRLIRLLFQKPND